MKPNILKNAIFSTVAFGSAAIFSTPSYAALTISPNPTENLSCSAGTCVATAADAVLNVTDLANMLASSSLRVQSGDLAKDIVFAAPFSWTSANELVLDSFHSITIGKPISDSGPAAFSLLMNDGGTAGSLSFKSKGRISFIGTSNTLTIDGQPYKLVRSVAALAKAVSHSPSGYFALAKNYDASKDGTYDAAPIATTFNGTFEGLGNTISNLSINYEKGSMPVGLFAVTGNTAALKSVRLTSIAYQSHVHKTGATGGLAGENTGYIFDDRVDGVIFSKLAAGGLVGSNGGTGTIANSSADVDIQATGAGGLVGFNQGKIATSFASGVVQRGEGGLVSANDGGTIVQSYATGKVKSRKGISGGFAGRDESSGTISESYSVGFVWGAEQGDLAGGFVGQVNSGNFSNNYWDTQTSGTDQGTSQGNIAGVTGLTTAQFKSGLPTGFDPNVWTESSSINHGYPYLIANPPPK